MELGKPSDPLPIIPRHRSISSSMSVNSLLLGPPICISIIFMVIYSFMTDGHEDPPELTQLDGPRTVEHYNALAMEALLAGEKDVASRNFAYARELELQDPTTLEEYVAAGTSVTIDRIQQLTQWGEEEVARDRRAEEESWGFVDAEKGAVLYDDTERLIAGLVLERLYLHLGVTQARVVAVPVRTGPQAIESDQGTPILDEVTVQFQTSWGIHLTEEHTSYADGGEQYVLWGRKLVDVPSL